MAAIVAYALGESWTEPPIRVLYWTVGVGKAAQTSSPILSHGGAAPWSRPGGPPCSSSWASSAARARMVHLIILSRES